MVETLLAAAIALVLLATAGGEGVVRLLFVAGASAITLGLAAGVPAGVVYHVKLHRELFRHGVAERGWWWRPTDYHERIPEPARRSLMPWFHAGATGFLVAIAGCALVVAAMFAQ